MENRKIFRKRLIFLIISMLSLNLILMGCEESVTIDFPSYTEEYKGEANLVEVEGYMFSELYNSSKGKTYYRFKINQENKDSVDIEVTDLDCFPTYADNTDVDYKDKLGKVYFYERTYNVSDSETIIRNIYKVYVTNDKVMEVSTDN